jgi:hypothetical protein
MSQRARQGYEQAMSLQHSKNEARRIRTLVKQAQENTQMSGFRWPFELLQNALDAGPRDGRDFVSVTITRNEERLTVAHDGRPFTFGDLAALLSGGSNKDFESTETTGRFGTGFLVTHAVATKIGLRGILAIDGDAEEFSLLLDREGDESEILANIERCREAIDEAVSLKNADDMPSACFEYIIDNQHVADAGIAAFKTSLPYLYATRPVLGRVELDLPEGREVWCAGGVGREHFEDGLVRRRSIQVQTIDSEEQDFDVYWFSETGESSSAVVIVDHDEDGHTVRVPSANIRKLFRDYPLQNAAFLPISFVLDGKFDPDPERSMIPPTDLNMEIVQKALAAAVLGVKYAFENDWHAAHLLAIASKPPETIWSGDDERTAWEQTLSTFAQRLSELPIVESRIGKLAAATSDTYADFVVPRLTTKRAADETSHDRMWYLLTGTTELNPPPIEISSDWTRIAYGWRSLDVYVNLVSIEELLQHVKPESDAVSDLKVKGPALEWLARLVDVLGEIRQKTDSDVTDYLESMLVNQNGKLRSPSQLRLDDGIPEQLKDIAASIRLDLRDELLTDQLETIADEHDLTFVASLLARLLPAVTSENDAIYAVISQLNEALPAERKCSDVEDVVKLASPKLVHFLWASRGADGRDAAAAIPLITSDEKSVRWSPQQMLIAPPTNWPESARPFADIYPEDRVLSDMYVDARDDGLECIEPLVTWKMAFSEPLYFSVLDELREPRLLQIAKDAEGVVIETVEVSQVAMLDRDLVNRCQVDPKRSKLLLGMVLTYVVPSDPLWRQERACIGRRKGEDVEVFVRPALWIADLKSRPWVAHETDDGIDPVKPNAFVLSEMLESGWLAEDGAAIDFLSICFDLRPLDLELLGFGDAKDAVMEELAQLVRAVGRDPEMYRRLREEIGDRAKKENDIKRAQRIGAAVEAAIEKLLLSYGLRVEIVDHGFDFKVMDQHEFSLEDMSWGLTFGEYYVEIKSTTTGNARMTPLQAKTASAQSSKYVLCVVDLRQMSDEELDSEWPLERIEALTKMLSSIGNDVRETWQLVEEAATAHEVRIRNESALRYEVPAEVWEHGLPMRRWADGLRVPLSEVNR